MYMYMESNLETVIFRGKPYFTGVILRDFMTILPGTISGLKTRLLASLIILIQGLRINSGHSLVGGWIMEQQGLEQVGPFLVCMRQTLLPSLSSRGKSIFPSLL